MLCHSRDFETLSFMVALNLYRCSQTHSSPQAWIAGKPAGKQKVGGSDGTRSRGLLRDRQAF